MNSGRKKTAIYRNFIRTPKIISGWAGLTAWLCVFTYLSGWPLSIQVFAWLVACGFSIMLANWMGDTLTRMRFQTWASDLHGIHPDDFDDYMTKIDAEELEDMVSWDFEGIFKEE